MASTESPHAGSRRMPFSAPRTAKSALCAADSAEVNPRQRSSDSHLSELDLLRGGCKDQWSEQCHTFEASNFIRELQNQPQAKNQTRALDGLRRFILWYLRLTSDTDVWIQTIAAKGKTTPCSSAVRILRRTRPGTRHRIPMSRSVEPSRWRRDWGELRLREADPQSAADTPALR
jgi:hypothetical protein